CFKRRTGMAVPPGARDRQALADGVRDVQRQHLPAAAAVTLERLMSSRQEVLNVLLAQLLHERGLVAAPEQIVRALQGGERGATRLPDVLVDFRGLRTAIEAEIGSGARAAHVLAYEKAKQRVDEGIAHIGVAVVYPAKLRQVGFHRLKEELSAA